MRTVQAMEAPGELAVPTGMAETEEVQAAWEPEAPADTGEVAAVHKEGATVVTVAKGAPAAQPEMAASVPTTRTPATEEAVEMVEPLAELVVAAVAAGEDPGSEAVLRR